MGRVNCQPILPGAVSLQAVLGYSQEAIGKMPDSEKIRVINAHYKRLIDQIRDSTHLPFTETGAGQNYPNPAD